MNINSVKFRLIFIIALVIFSLGLVAVMSTSGLRNAEANFEDLYINGLGHSNRANLILQNIGDARSSLLLAFQHDPDSKFASMHDHPVSLHLDAVNDSLVRVHKIIDNELLPVLPKNGEEWDIMNRMAFELDAVDKGGFQKSISEIEKGDYTEANRILLTVINPRFKLLDQEGAKFLSLQLENAKETHTRTANDTSTFITTFIIITIVASAIIIVLSWFIIRRIDGALQRVQAAAQKVSAGDLTLRVDLTGNDEFAVLSRYVDEIVGSFQSVITNMNECALHLASSAEESSAVAVQTKQNIVDQQQQTQLVATAIHEFTSTVQEVANSAASAAEASQEAESATNEGMEVVQNTIGLINELNDEIASSTRIIQELSQQSNDIGTVVDVIDDISEQTNLLALNAAIEAARAGEAGRGFAVVADEVRSLASRTQKSTEEIKSMINSLQSSSNDSMQRMEHGSQQARLTAEKAQLAGSALEKIAASVDRINNMNAQIATAAEQQSTVTNEINQNVTNINDISVQTASGAEQSSAATQALAELTEDMRGNVSRFKY